MHLIVSNRFDIERLNSVMVYKQLIKKKYELLTSEV